MGHLDSEFSVEELLSLLELWPTINIANPVDPFPSPSGWSRVSEADLGLGVRADQFYFPSQVSDFAGVQVFRNIDGTIAVSFTGVSFFGLTDVFSQAMPTPPAVTTTYADSFAAIYTAIQNTFGADIDVAVVGFSAGAVAVNQLVETFATHFPSASGKFLALGSEFVGSNPSVLNIGASNDWLFGSYNEFLAIGDSIAPALLDSPTFSDLFFLSDDEAAAFGATSDYSPMFDFAPHLQPAVQGDWYFDFGTSTTSLTFSIDGFFDAHGLSGLVDALGRTLRPEISNVLDRHSDIIFDFSNGAVLVGNSGAFVRSGSEPVFVIGENDPTGTDHLIGTNHREHFFGLDGIDVIDAEGGDDVVEGGAGDDELSGGSGADLLDGGMGADQLNGGDDFDYASYLSAVAPVVASLFGAGNTGDAAGDVYSEIEGIVGSGFSDALVGDNSANALFGSNGFDYIAGFDGADYIDGGSDWDYIEGGGGADFIVGGQGNDTWSAFTGVEGAAIFLYQTANQVVNDGFGNTETLTSIEWVVGSQFLDVIVGDGNNNVLQGMSGDDVFYAGLGHDYIVGGRGNDFMQGDDGFDVFAIDRFDFEAGVFDTITDFSESATSFDMLHLTGLDMSDILLTDFGGGVFVSTVALNNAGAVFLQGFTAAQLADQMMFA